MHPKIRCEYKTFTPQIIAKTLYNISTNQYEFIYVDNHTTIYFDNLHFNLLCYDVPDSLNGYPIFPITYSVEWIFIQKTLNQLDDITKSNIMIILSGYPSKLLSIIDAILSFPINYDIICIIITNIFANIGEPTTLYTQLNNEWTLFCVEFGNTCNYHVKFMIQDNIVRRLINHFITIKMDKTKANIMCTSESFTALMLYNEYIFADFTLLVFDHNSGKISTCLLHSISSARCSNFVISKSPFEIKKMYFCAVTYDLDNDTHKLTRERKILLINKIIETLSEKIEKRTWRIENNELFY